MTARRSIPGPPRTLRRVRPAGRAKPTPSGIGLALAGGGPLGGIYEVGALLALADSLEGLTRNVGMHAGGVLIAPGKLTDFCPLYVGDGSDAAVSQFDKDDVEAVGLVKFDFLGLTTLTILDLTLRFRRRLDPPNTPLTTCTRQGSRP